jgi:hypothetical protein
MPATSGDKAVYAEFGNEFWWLNLDSRGGLWINGREKRAGETIASANAAEAAAPAEGAPADGAAAGSAENAPAAATGEPVVEAAAVATAAADGAVADGQSAVAVPANEPVRETAPAAGYVVPVAETAVVAAPVETASAVAPAPAEAVAPVAVEGAPAGASAGHPVLAGVRLLLKETRSGGIAGKVERLAGDLGKPVDELTAALVAAGLKVPEKPREKPVFVEHAGEILWFNRNARGELWLNAKPAKFAGKDDEADAGDEPTEADAAGEAAEADEAGGESEGGEGDAEKKPRRPRPRTKKAE